MNIQLDAQPPYFTHLPLSRIYRPMPNPLFHTYPLTWDIQTNAQPPILPISPHLGYTDQCPTPYITQLPSSGIYRPMPNPLFYPSPLTWDIQTNAQPPILPISPHLGYTEQCPTPYFTHDSPYLEYIEQCPTPYFTHIPLPGIFRTLPNPLFHTYSLT